MARRNGRHRPHPGPLPPEQLLDRDGKILWPSTIPTDPSAVAARGRQRRRPHRLQESNSTGHASVRPVADAKNKLTVFAAGMPEIRAKNATDAAILDTFIFDLENALDALTYTY